MNDIDYKAVIEIIESFINNEKVEILGISVGEEHQLGQALENLIQRNKELEQIEKEHKEENGKLRDRINKTINKLNEDISDDNCMWVNNQEKIVKTAKTIIDRSNYAKEILELLEESER